MVDDEPPTDDESSSSDSDENENAPIIANAVDVIRGKDETIWHNLPLGHLLNTGRAAGENVVRLQPGPTSFAKRRIESASTAFFLMIDVPTWRKIHAHTVQHAIRQNETNYVITFEDLLVFLGLVIARGVFCGKNEPSHSLWSVEDGRSLFRESMPRDKFLFILRHLRFDDTETRPGRRNADKFCAIRDLWECFIRNSQAARNPSEVMTVDEQLFPMKARCPFTQFMPNKPDKFGVKFWLLCDAVCRYTYNGLPYLGRDATIDRNGLQLGEHVTMQLLAPYFNGGYNVTTDNFFTSHRLSSKLLEKKLTLVGTMRKSRREIPPALQHQKARQVNSVIAVKHEASKSILLSYKAKKDKTVIMLSSFHKSAVSVEGQKPEIVAFYNATKCGVDAVDQMARCYSTKSASRRWPLQIFFNIIDLAAINSFTLFSDIQAVTISRRNYLITLAKELIALGKPEPQQAAVNLTAQPADRPAKRVKCRRCQTNNTRVACSQCHVYVCGSCSGNVCKVCLNT